MIGFYHFSFTMGHSTLSELTLNSVQKSSMVSSAAIQVQFLSNEESTTGYARRKKTFIDLLGNFNSVLIFYTALEFLLRLCCKC